eukprot:9499634-Pyramimonas_sp.AAC.1
MRQKPLSSEVVTRHWRMKLSPNAPRTPHARVSGRARHGHASEALAGRVPFVAAVFSSRVPLVAAYGPTTVAA